MKVAVIGLGHTGCVTAACLANSTQKILAYDSDPALIVNLKNNIPPIFEPGLEELIQINQETKALTFTDDVNSLKDSEILYITFDSPVDENDIADVDYVTNEIKRVLPYAASNTLVLITSQLPVGTTRKLMEFTESKYPHKNITFAYTPENLRLGGAIHAFTKPARVVIGLQTAKDQERLTQLFAPFSETILWMSIESAEMSKHALNAFLATSIVFTNEIATICEQVGANASDIEQALKSDERVGKKAYLRAGGAIGGGTLARDINFLNQISSSHNLTTPLFSSILISNQAHKQWACQRLQDTLKSLKNKTITSLGLTYKAGTNTLRRSSAIEMCQWLADQGAKILAYDPVLTTLPSQYAKFIDLKTSISQALAGSDAVVISTEWQQFLHLTANELVAALKNPLIFDASGFLMQTIGKDSRLKYFSVGIST